VLNDVDEAAHFALQVFQLVTAGIDIDHFDGFLWIWGDNEGIHTFTMKPIDG
jgi:hypothetical protein